MDRAVDHLGVAGALALLGVLPVALIFAGGALLGRWIDGGAPHASAGSMALTFPTWLLLPLLLTLGMLGLMGRVAAAPRVAALVLAFLAGPLAALLVPTADGEDVLTALLLNGPVALAVAPLLVPPRRASVPWIVLGAASLAVGAACALILLRLLVLAPPLDPSTHGLFPFGRPQAVAYETDRAVGRILSVLLALGFCFGGALHLVAGLGARAAPAAETRHEARPVEDLVHRGLLDAEERDRWRKTMDADDREEGLLLHALGQLGTLRPTGLTSLAFGILLLSATLVGLGASGGALARCEETAGCPEQRSALIVALFLLGMPYALVVAFVVLALGAVALAHHARHAEALRSRLDAVRRRRERQLDLLLERARARLAATVER